MEMDAECLDFISNNGLALHVILVLAILMIVIGHMAQERLHRDHVYAAEQPMVSTSMGYMKGFSFLV